MGLKVREENWKENRIIKEARWKKKGRGAKMRPFPLSGWQLWGVMLREWNSNSLVGNSDVQ